MAQKFERRHLQYFDSAAVQTKPERCSSLSSLPSASILLLPSWACFRQRCALNSSFITLQLTQQLYTHTINSRITRNHYSDQIETIIDRECFTHLFSGCLYSVWLVTGFLMVKTRPLFYYPETITMLWTYFSEFETSVSDKQSNEHIWFDTRMKIFSVF